MGGDTPLDDDIYEFESGSNNTRKPDSGMISAVVKEVVKALSSNHGASNINRDTTRMSNFAGKLYASNAGNYNECYNYDTWIVDTGASAHMAGNIKMFQA